MTEELTLSEQLKRRRQVVGLSLAELGRRVGTSAATLSRYEHGWTRFETYTLQKLAASLECELRIEFVPHPKPSSKTISKARAIKQLRRLFWDHPLVAQDLDQYPVWVMERVLDYGGLADVRLLIHLFGRKQFLEIVARVRRVSAKTMAFWRQFLDLEGYPCTKKFYRNTAWNY
jgi:transcriptional regulator with XRE-family HTH domain